MAAPVEIMVINPRMGTTKWDLAVRENDGNIQELVDFRGKSIAPGSILRVCSSDWSEHKAVYTRLPHMWSRLTTFGG